MKALLIPIHGPLEYVELDGSLDQLQTLVGGYIEALNLPRFVKGFALATGYVNEEGKFKDWAPDAPEDAKLAHLGFNGRATDFMVPGAGLFAGDYIAGPFLLCGFDPRTGEHAVLPQGVIDRAELIDKEASRV